MVNKKERNRRSRFMGAMLHLGAFLIVVALGLFMVQRALEIIESSPYFQLDRIQFHGVEHGDVGQLERLISKNFPDRTLEIDLETARSLIESETWVKSALVRRKLPDQLIIYVEERVPTAVAAIDSGLYVVDPEGVILAEFGPDYEYLDQPIVRGLQNVARENALAANAVKIRTYLQVIKDLSLENHNYTDYISEIDVENPERVAVFPTEDPVAVYLGNENYRERYETFLSQKQLYLDLKKKYGSIEYIDMTYEDRIIFHTPEEAISG